MLDSLRQDTRQAVRLLLRHPTFTIVAVLSTAIGIGANTAIFALVNELLLRPPAGVERPDELVDLGRTQDGGGFDTVSYPNYLDYRSRNQVFSDIYAYRLEPQAVSLGGRTEAERIYASAVSGNFFSVLGVRPALGRLLAESDDRLPGPNPVIVLSHHLWERRFNSDRSILGETVRINGDAFLVAGVAPQGFTGTTVLTPDAWVPLTAGTQGMERTELFSGRQFVWLVMAGRLKPGVSIEQGQAAMTSLASALEKEYPDANKGKGIALAALARVPGRTGMIAAFMAVLMTLVGLVLLIASVNLAGMMLARATGRRRELAVRLAIGAARGRLVRQLLTESIVLFLCGGATGLLVAVWLRSLLLALVPNLPFPIAFELPLDTRVLIFTVVVSAATGLLAGLAPAILASRSDLMGVMKADGTSKTLGRLRMRDAFLVGQVAMSLLLVVAAALFIRALDRAGSVDPGFDPSHVRTFGLDLTLAGTRESADGSSPSTSSSARKGCRA